MTYLEQLRSRREEMEIEHSDAMRDLYHEIARNRGLGPFEELNDASKNLLIRDATTMCQAWDADRALRFSHMAGKSRIVDLVDAQYKIARAIIEIDNRIASIIAAQSRHG